MTITKEELNERKTYGNISENATVKLQEYSIMGSLINEKQVTGTMFGDDECWEINEFYQYLETEKTLYKVYFEISDELMENINNGTADMGDVDYTKAYKYEEYEIVEE